MRPETRHSYTLLISSCTLAVLVTLGTLHLFGPNLGSLPSDEVRALRIVHDQILREHVTPHEPDALLRAAIAGMVKSVDRYSAFVPPDAVGEFERDTTGAYQGVGITLAPATTPATVYYVLSGGPAERAGLRVGDRIERIDDEDATQWAKDEVIGKARERLLGKPGTSVRLSLRALDDTRREVVIERGSVQQHSIKWVRWLDQAEGLGYVYLSTFQKQTPEELDAALSQLGAEATLRGLVLDLRDNSGGLLDECVAVANRFLVGGNILSLRKRGGVEISRFDANPALATHQDLPLVLLVDGDSASASEVLAGALQDHHRAQLVGERTFGKGVVQSIFRWEGLDFRLKLTTAHYYTPSGRCIEGHLGNTDDGGDRGAKPKGGLEPDVVVALPAAQARDVPARLAGYDIPAPYKAAARALAAALAFRGELEPAGPDADDQLEKALELLRTQVRDARKATGR